MRTNEHASELGRWRSAWRAAAAPLRPFVHGYFGSESSLPGTVRERHVPSFSVSLFLNFASPHRLLHRDMADVRWGQRAWIVGLQGGYRLADAMGERQFLVAQLTPLGAHHILRERMDLLSDRIVDLDDIDPLFARSLLARAGAASSWDARFDAVEAAIIDRLGMSDLAPTVASIALRSVQASGGDLDIGKLALTLGCSHRHLIATFRGQVGLPPKAVARLLRFERAVEAINRRDNLDYAPGEPYLDGRWAPANHGPGSIRWSELALACGYYDQSHFINEFRTFSGATPEAFRRQLDRVDVPA
jgi:AraC-like DNA-binding protein